MATIKSYTDINQSKKLAEILPIESADMFFIAGKGEPVFIGNKMVACGEDDYDALGGPDVLCWSLASLLDVLESEIDGEEGETYQLNLEKEGTWWYLCYREQYDSANPIEVESTEELVDACCEMIFRLHELNLL